ncbi:MAG TPA: serine hydrolase domain-containing protein [Cyclobacteriaceae bacterium]|nr:serine hydrolase domain-containing protein [Cyclobacteriaceae bacterium]
MRKTLTNAILFLLVVQIAAAQSAKSQHDLSKQVDALFAPWAKEDSPGAVVAVVKEGKIIYKKGYGMANLEYGIPNTPSSVFHIASVSKQFTVFSVLLLEKEGKLSLEDDVRKYIPEVPDFGKTITLRHLASHTSGMRDQWNLLVMAGWRFDDVITKEHIMKMVTHQKELNADPGEEFNYCNTGFTLLAEVVARVSGKSFAEFTKERIFNPLGMMNTLFYDDHEKIVKNRAYSYHKDDGGYKKSVLSYANVGATSLFTTVEDLSLWAMNFETPKVGDQSIFGKMNQQAVLNNGEKIEGALGQFVTPYKGLNQIQHGGADAGYRTYLGRFPDQHFAVIVFSNEASFSPGQMALKVADIYLKDEFSEDKNNKPAAVKYIKLPAKQLEQYCAAYWNEEEKYARKIYLRNDTLRYWRNERSEDIILPAAKDEFKMPSAGVDFTVKFAKNQDGKKTMVVMANGPSNFVEYKAPTYSESDLAQFTGTFYSDELSTYYHFKVKDGKLISEHMRMSDISYTPIKDDVFSGSTYFTGLVEFERDRSSRVNGFRVSNGRVMNLVFKKVD